LTRVSQFDSISPMFEIHVRVRKEQHEWLRKQVYERHASVAFIIRELLDKAIKREQNREDTHA
jgi:hypothetical protein